MNLPIFCTKSYTLGWALGLLDWVTVQGGGKNWCDGDCTWLNSDCVLSVLPNPLVRNGICNDEINVKECNFDGGECCSTNCNAITVMVKKDPANILGNLAGVYHKSSIINGKPSWTSTSTAIW